MVESTPPLADLSRAKLDRLIRRLRPAAAAGPQLVRRDRAEGRLPASFGQERLWFLDRLDGPSPTYNLAGRVDLEGTLDTAALARSLGAIEGRHEALRTTFRERDGRLWQIFDQAPPLRLAWVDLGGLPPRERESVSRRLEPRFARRPFDLETGPLWRAVILRETPRRHRLLLAMHHIISDGWSLGVLLAELGALYPSFCSASRREPASEPLREPLPELPIQFADFAVWQRESLTPERSARELEFWRGYLDGSSEELAVPTDRPRLQRPSSRGALVPVALPPDLGAALRRLAQAGDATVFMVLVAAWEALRSRLSGRTDLVLGTVTAGRSRVESEGLIGFFVQTLAVRTRLEGDPSAATLLSRVRGSVLDALAHQDLPFDRLVDALRGGRGDSEAPLFRSMIVLQDRAARTISLPGLDLSLHDIETATSKFDLVLDLIETSDGGYAGAIELARDLFDVTTVLRLRDGLLHLLSGFAATPEHALSTLPLLSAAERWQLAGEWNDTARRLPDGVSVDGLFESWAARDPERIALVAEAPGDGFAHWSYAALEQCSAALAAELASLGVRRDGIVTVVMERSAELALAAIAVLRAGAGYMALDPAHPQERLLFQIADAGVSVVLQRRGAPTLPLPEGVTGLEVGMDAPAPVFIPSLVPAGLTLEDERRSVGRFEIGPYGRRQSADVGVGFNPARGRLASANLPDQLSFVLYTSGSTGQPKGSMLTHRALLSLMLWHAEDAAARPGWRRALAAGPGFDASVWELWSAFANGGTLVVAPGGLLTSPRELVAWLAQHRIKGAFLATPVAELVCREELPRDLALERLDTGGDRLHLGPPPGAPFVLCNVYGPTETTVLVTTKHVPSDVEGVPTIGPGVANTRLFIATRAGRQQVLGGVGELLIGGLVLGRGYLRRPRLTAERFIPDALSGEVGARLYCTGDLVRRLPNGELDFIGRIDTQVKLRGQRIELGEIEAALLAQPGVREAVVVLREDPERYLAAYVSLLEDAASSEAVLREALARQLPAYMVPSTFVVLPALPLTPNGKVDRRALPRPDWQPQARVVAPRTATERQVLEVWGEVLGQPVASVEESFFALGGHSLLATRVVSRLREVCGVELPLRSLFERPTAAEIAREVDALRGVAADEAPPLVARSRATTAETPLSFAQERLWLLEQLAPGRATYNVPAALAVHGEVDFSAFAWSLERVLARHEVLRTVYREDTDGPVQVVAPAGRVHLPVVDLSGLEQTSCEPLAKTLLATEAARPFDLARGPVLRAVWVRLALAEHLLSLTVHHIATDGWSVPVLVSEMGRLYEARLGQGADSLPPLPVQYGDYAVWQRGWLRGAALERQLSYWRQQLAGLPPALELPLDRPRPAVQGHVGVRIAVASRPGLMGQLEALAQRLEATVFMVLAAALEALLARWTGQHDFALGTPIANRRHAELEGLIGFFVNTLVLRANLAGDPTFGELVGRVREDALGAYAHQDVPFERLVEDLALERQLDRSPVFQVMLAFQNQGAPPARLGAARVEGLAVHSGTAKFDLTFELMPAADGCLEASLELASDLFDATTGYRLVNQLLAALDRASTRADLSLGRLVAPSVAERWQLAGEWNDTTRPWLGLRPVDVRFEDWAREAPERIAVLVPGTLESDGTEGQPSGPEYWTYAALDRRSLVQAAHLAELGVRRDGIVAVAMERSGELVLAALAVLRAGAAYLPLDPAHPEERLRWQIEDAGVPVVLRRRGGPDLALPAGVIGIEIDLQMGTPPIDAVRPSRVISSGGALNDLDQISYVLYTSGSTGLPKGSMLTHGGLANLVDWQHEEIGWRPGTRCSLAAGPGFDASVWELWRCLATGGTLVVAPAGLLTSPSDLVGWLGRHRIEVAFLATPVAELVFHERLPPDLALRHLDVGGDRLHHGPPAGAPFRLWNVYGPSETTVAVSAGPVPAEPKTGAAELERGASASVPAIGRGLANTRLYLVDRALDLQPFGAPGELLIGGRALGRGYLRRPRLTAQSFVPDAHSGEAGARLYRTGDLVRRLPNGELDFLGRIDTQVKLRGQRIELGEIEAALLAEAAVREAVVILREDGERYLAAYVVLDPAASDPGEDAVREDLLRGALARRLPSYMVPPAFVFLEVLPLNPNGKVDRRSLPRPERSARAAAVPPRTETERLVLAIWRDVLGHEVASVEESFFALGGHSLLATRIVSRVREVCGVELPLRKLFEAPTIADLAREIDLLSAGNPLGSAAGPPVLAIRGDRRARRPGVGMKLSYAQERQWLLEQLTPGRAAYNVDMGLALRGSIDLRAFEWSLNRVIERHEILRTRYVVVGLEPRQVVDATVRLRPPVVDLGALAEPCKKRVAARLLATTAGTPFDLERGPVLRALWLRLAEREHRFLLVVHHIATDGWSMSLFVDEIGRLLDERRTGVPAALPALEIQYGEYAGWQRRWLHGEEIARQSRYWRERLAGMPHLLALPLDRPRPPVQEDAGGRVLARMEGGVVSRLEALARSHDATLFMVATAAFEAQLGRWSGQRDFGVGTTIANRQRTELEPMIGLFVNTLVLRAELGGDPSFVELLARVREDALGAYAHQDLPFERLVEELAPARDLAVTPLFQTMILLFDQPQQTPRWPDLEIELLPASTETTQFDLSLDLFRVDGGLMVRLEYARDLFDRTTAQRFLASFLRTLERAAEVPRRRLSELEGESAAERWQVLGEWNDTAREVPEEATVDRLFAAARAAAPDRIAVVATEHGGEEALWSYAELDRRAELVATELLARGVEPEVRVGLLLERSWELVIAALAVVRAGGAYVALDPALPEERLAYQLRDSAVRLALVSPRTRSLPLPAEVEAFEVSGDPPAPRSLATLGRKRGPSRAAINLPDQLAYVVYTSGSSGWPKGTLLTHRGLSSLIAWQHVASGERAGWRRAMAHGPGFDVSVLELWGALANGGTLALVPDELLLEPTAFVRWLASRAVAEMTVPTPVGELLLREPMPAFMALERLSLGGDRLRLPPPAGLPFEVINEYGPTETTVQVTSGTVPPGGERLPSIGRPLWNARLYVVTPELRPQAAGAPGELLIGGALLARGYLGRPALTARSFVPDPFGDAPGERLYRTGDLVRWRANGALEFLGRIDTQVKLRGQRIELGEIEAALLACDGVREAAVVLRPENGGSLAAYLVPEGSFELAAVRTELARRLSSAMVPSVFIRLDALPRTPNGKVDRAALPAPELEAGSRDAASPPAGPRNAVEEELVAIWRELLGVEHFGIEDDFFALGGHSLTAVQLVSRVRERLGVELSVRSIFETRTVSELARRIADASVVGRSLRASGSEPPAGSDDARPDEAILAPLSYSQERLWFLEQFQPGTATYNMPVAMRLDGALSIEVLSKSWNALVRRQGSLRTTFVSLGGAAQQRVAPFERVKLPVIDLSCLPAEARASVLAPAMAREGGRGFDIARGPLWRVRLLRESSGSHVLLITLHHIVSDGWSMQVLLQDILALYASFHRGVEPALKELPLQYHEHARRQRERTSGGALARQLAYWREKLGGELAVLDLATDRPRPPVQTFEGGSLHRMPPSALVERLRALSRQAGGTLFMTLLAAFQVLLHRLSGQDDVLVGTPVAGRDRYEIEGLIGFFLNTVVLRTDLSGNPSFLETLRRVRTTALDAYSNQDVPFERVLDELKVERDLSRTPLFQVYFNFQSFDSVPLEMPGVKLSMLAVPADPSKFDMTLYVNDDREGLRLDLVYNADLFSEARMSEMMAQYFDLLEAFSLRPQVAVDAPSLVTQAARALLPDRREPLSTAWHGAVHELFARHAAASPERVALVDQYGTWSYAALHAQARAMAARLRAGGIERGDRVAILAHRSAALVWAVLGTLEAGAAFVMLDPAYPGERLLQMLEIAEPRAFLRLEAAGEPAAEVEQYLGGVRGLVRFDVLKAPSAAEPDESEREAIAVGPNDLGYIAFTSGSTGKPKGILGRHGPLSHFLPWQCGEFGLTSEDRFSMLSGLSHDPLQRDIFTPLFLGARITVPLPQEAAAPALVRAWMRREGVTVAVLTPALGQLLTEDVVGETESGVPSLARVFLVGDVLTRRDAARIQALSARVQVVNLYGSTETQRAVAYHRVERQDASLARGMGAEAAIRGGVERAKEVLPLGRGMRDAQLLVLNRSQGLAGIGEVGEIAMRSPHLARGYAGDAELTSKRFVRNPYSDDPEDRLYLTGDLGRYLPNGEVVFCGRADAQVKIRGFRIELGEIQATLGDRPGVREAIVLAREGASGDKRLVAYVVPESGAQLEVAALRAHVASRLPAYMVPTSFVLLERLPLTPNGKVDRKALMSIDDRERAAPAAGRKPANRIEAQLVTIFREILEIEHIGVEDNFFDLGGNSLLLVRVHARIQTEFGCELQLVDLFNRPTIRLLAELLGGAGPDAASAVNEGQRASELAAGRGRLQKRLAQRRRDS